MPSPLTKEHLDSILRDLRRDPVKFLGQFQIAIVDPVRALHSARSAHSVRSLASERPGRVAALPTKNAVVSTETKLEGEPLPDTLHDEALVQRRAVERAGLPRQWGANYRDNQSAVVIEFSTRRKARAEPIFAHAVVPQVLHEATAGVGLLAYELGPQGPDLMLTEQLTSACFVMVRVSDRVYCGHFVPAHAHDADRLCQLLRERGRFAGLPAEPLWVLGPTDYPHCTAQVLGIRKGGSWQLVAQLRATAPTGPTDGPQRVVRLGPG